MGALGPYLEGEGLPTAGFSLIRLHTEKIRPPRALWVPFELGRPLGVPNDAAFQTRVLKALLATFDEATGPVLADYPEDASGGGTEDMTGMACTIILDRPAATEETLGAAVLREVRELQPWYDLARERRQRTTFGSAGLDIEDVAGFLARWLDQMPPESPRAEQSPEAMLKLAAEDLKAFYFEAVAGQPQPMTGRAAADWFWGETSAAELFVALRERCIADADPAHQLIGRNLLVPREQWSRFGITERWWRAPSS